MAEQITDVSRRSPSSEYKVYARIINFTFINSRVSFFNRTWKRSWLSFLTKSFLQIIFGQIISFEIAISEIASIVGALKGGNLFRFFCFCFVCFLVIRPILKKCGIYLNTIHLDLVKNIYIANDNVTRALWITVFRLKLLISRNVGNTDAAVSQNF